MKLLNLPIDDNWITWCFITISTAFLVTATTKQKKFHDYYTKSLRNWTRFEGNWDFLIYNVNINVGSLWDLTNEKSTPRTQGIVPHFTPMHIKSLGQMTQLCYIWILCTVLWNRPCTLMDIHISLVTFIVYYRMRGGGGVRNRNICVLFTPARVTNF